MNKKIAILFHENNREHELLYFLNHLAETWREDGNEVILIFGVAEFVPADIIIVHIDLSVVPDEYLEFAKRYPISLNSDVKDIRKSTFSSLIVRPGDGYDGKVIVKSNLNCGGAPERILGVETPASSPFAPDFQTAMDYRIYDNPLSVPQPLFEDSTVVVEKFLPEFKDGFYAARNMFFLGDTYYAVRYTSESSSVSAMTANSIELIEPHPDVVAFSKKMKFDYGKFDYIMHDGRPVVLDINKTIGRPAQTSNPEIIALRRAQARALYGYFDRQ